MRARFFDLLIGLLIGLLGLGQFNCAGGNVGAERFNFD